MTAVRLGSSTRFFRESLGYGPGAGVRRLQSVGPIIGTFGAATSTTTNVFPIILPAGCVPGDLLIVFGRLNSTSVYTMTGPSGWTTDGYVPGTTATHYGWRSWGTLTADHVNAGVVTFTLGASRIQHWTGLVVRGYATPSESNLATSAGSTGSSPSTLATPTGPSGVIGDLYLDALLCSNASNTTTTWDDPAFLIRNNPSTSRDDLVGTVLTADGIPTARTVVTNFYNSYNWRMFTLRLQRQIRANLPWNTSRQGLFYALGTAWGAVEWSNPIASTASASVPINGTTGGSVTLSTYNSAQGYQPRHLTDRTAYGVFTESHPNSTFTFDFGTNLKIAPTGFSLQQRAGGNLHRTIQFSGSNDGTSWSIFYTGTATTVGEEWWDHTGLVVPPYRYIRLTHTSVDSSNQNYFVIGEVEFYGHAEYS